jgi:glycosyltransferase involved in cell wall biosynthesis
MPPKGVPPVDSAFPTPGVAIASPRPLGRAVGSRALSVCKVWQVEYPWDVRAEKVALAITLAGHHVNLVARNRTGLPQVEQLREATVHRLASWRWAPSWFNAASMVAAFFNPRWFRHILRVARRTHADVILCRDLPLAITSVVVGRRLGIPVVLDMAENYPAMLQSRRSTGRAKPWDALVRNPAVARLIERWVVARVDAILVVVEESRDRLTGMGVPPERIALVCNTPPLARLDTRPATHNDDRTAPLTAVYLGRVEEQRGIGTLLDAVSQLRAAGFPVALTIYGDGKDFALYRARAQALGLGPPSVVFRGQVPNDLALTELAEADVGIIPHWRDEQFDTTLPNKIFDYMAAGLPVVTSDATPLRRIVEATGCGRVFRDRDAAGLAQALRELGDAAVRRMAGERGRAAIRTTYNWERDVERLLAVLQAVVAGRGHPQT